MDENSPIDAEKVAPVDEVPREKSGRCCVCGCLGLLAFSILAMVGAGGAAYWFISSQVVRWTADTPSDLPVVEFTEEQFTRLDARLETFEEDLDQGRSPERLELSAEEINALIARDDDLKGRVFVRIEDGVVSGDISIPMDLIPFGQGRFLNASASFDAKLEGGVLVVTLTAAEVKGEPLPDEFVQAMSRENLAKDVYQDPEVAAVLSKFESIEFVGDKIVLVPREGTASSNEGSVPPDEGAEDSVAPAESESESASGADASENTSETATAAPEAAEPEGESESTPAADPESPVDQSPAPAAPAPSPSPEEPAADAP